MKRTIEISASFTGTINTGQYENSKPFYSVKEIVEDCALNVEEIEIRQKQLHDICYSQFKKQADMACLDRIKAQYKHIRFYGEYPSVTSIIGYDADFHMSEEELSQYGARGSILHKQVEIYLLTSEWKKPEKIPEVYADLVTMKKGSLGLSLEEGYNFIDFFKDYPFKVIDLERKVINDSIKYGGRYDIKCIIESSNKGKWGKIAGIKFDVPTILDIKSGSIDKPKHFMQQTAYAKCCDDVEQIGLIPLNNTTAQGFSKPIMESDVERWLPMFFDKREKFRSRFGV